MTVPEPSVPAPDAPSAEARPGAAGTPDRPPRFWQRHPTLVYSALRLVLLLATLGIVWLLGARGLLWLLLGFLISGLVSLVMLSGQRDAMSRGVAGFFGRLNDRIEASRRAEDDEPDDAERADDDARALAADPAAGAAAETAAAGPDPADPMPASSSETATTDAR